MECTNPLQGPLTQYGTMSYPKHEALSSPTQVALTQYEPVSSPTQKTLAVFGTMVYKPGPLSVQNKRILENLRAKIASEHLNFAALQKQESFWSKIWSYLPFPSAKTTGQTVGQLTAITHGAQLSNAVIDRLTPALLPHGLPAIGINIAAEVTKLALNPYVLPLVGMALTQGGGIVLQATAFLAGCVYNRIMKQPDNTLSLEDLSAKKSVFTVMEDGTIVDVNGEMLTTRDLLDIAQAVNTYVLTCKLCEAQKEDVENIFNEYLKKAISPISAKHFAIITVAKEQLQSANSANNFEKIEKAINLLVKYANTEPEMVENLRHLQRSRSAEWDDSVTDLANEEEWLLMDKEDKIPLAISNVDEPKEIKSPI